MQSETSSADPPANPRILVANSDPEELRYIAGILGHAGYLVELAESTGAVSFALEHSAFALAVVDARMRAYMRHSLTEYLAQFRNVRWIEVTDPTAFAPSATSAAAVLTRPVTPEALLRTVRRVLATVPADAAHTEPVERSAVDTVSRVLRQRLLEQQALSTLARSLSAVLDLDTLLTQVVDAAVQLCNAEEGLLLLPDEDGQELYVRAAKGMDSETARNFRLKTQDSLAGKVFRTGQPVLIGDRGPQKITTAYLVRSLLYVPLSIKGQVIGVLGVNNRLAQRTFSQHDRELLQDLAAHAAVAIENARLYEESVLRTRELRTLVQAAEATNSTLAIDRVLSIIASQLIGALNVGQCYITEWRDEGCTLAPLAVRYRALWQPVACPPLAVHENPALQQILHSQQPVVLTPAEEETMSPVAVWSPQVARARSVLYVPLYAHGKLLGAAIFYRFHTPYPAPVVPQAATTALHRRALQVMVTLVGHDAENYRESLFRDVQAMLSVAEADWCDVALWNAGQRQFEVKLSLGEVIWADEERPCFALSRYEGLDDVLLLTEAHTDADHDMLARLCRDGYGQSLLTIPLVIKGEPVGVVFLVDTLQQRRFSQREVRLAQALVSQAANAMDNARLYRDLARSLEELHRTQSKLVQTARLSAMGELAAAVAHQINNPLTTILGDAEMLLSDTPNDDPNFEALEAIFRAGKRAHEVVRRLLAMARQQPVEDVHTAIDVNETVRNTLALVKSHVQQGNVRLVVRLEEDLPPVTGAPGQLEDVWLNLLLNARDAVAERAAPQVGIATRRAADARHIEVEVWDNGVGIPAEEQARVFEPFFTTKPPGAGTGLGLHICKQIVEKFGGRITLQSIYNKGTRFVVQLPVSASE